MVLDINLVNFLRGHPEERHQVPVQEVSNLRLHLHIHILNKHAIHYCNSLKINPMFLQLLVVVCQLLKMIFNFQIEICLVSSPSNLLISYLLSEFFLDSIQSELSHICCLLYKALHFFMDILVFHLVVILDLADLRF